MSKKLSVEERRRRLLEVGLEEVPNTKVYVQGERGGFGDVVDYKCIAEGYVFTRSVSRIHARRGCPICDRCHTFQPTVTPAMRQPDAVKRKLDAIANGVAVRKRIKEQSLGNPTHHHAT